jgi:uncharacterized protein
MKGWRIMLATGVILFLVYHGLLLYFGWNGWVWLRSVWRERLILRYLYVLGLMLLAYSFFLGRWLDNNLIVTVIGAYWIAVFYFLIFLLPLANLTVFLSRFTRWSKLRVIQWTGFATMVLLVLLVGWGAYNAYSPVVRSYQITIPKAVPDRQQLNIVMASDMHFGALSGSAHAKRLVERINAMKPDVVLFPGDIIDDDLVYYLKKGMPDILKQIEAPVYASLGNHDRMQGDLIRVLEESGMEVLYDETILFDDRYTLIGRKDRRDRSRAELAQLMQQADTTKPVILLDHQPYDFDIAKNLGVDLLVAGHTHRGQIAPASLVTDKMYENDWGFLQKGQLHTIVSSGYGFWGTPIRTGTRSEIVQIHVTFAP